ncbi:hypothetical protein [Natrinema sp. DC36]|uniref:hypothetical protein n=1 Tax=Natrinema sp. DC36 TaxID=2878680 RepID=UPI001CF0BC18|nr:hypothetical protein [Natrinema sp. DC36]
MSTIPEDYEPPEAQIIGETEVNVKCSISEIDGDICSGWSETVELEAPAHYGENGEKVILPGYWPECEECGNPHDFEIDGVRLTFGL